MKSNKIISVINEEIIFNPEYKNIRNKINVNQYIKEENNKINYKLISAFASLCLVVIVSISLFFNSSKIKYISSNIVTYNLDKEVVDAYNHIFVAKVNSKINKHDKNNPYKVPNSYYDIKIIDVLKGEKIDKDLCFYGGETSLKNKIYLKENDELIKENEYYLFFTNVKDDNYIVARNDQKIELSDYDENLSMTNQLGSNKYIIKRYLNVVNKIISEYTEETIVLPSKKELAKLYSYNSIVKINNIIPTDTFTNGEGSEVPTVFYNISILKNFKDESLEGNLCCFGVDYWYEEGVNISYPKGVKLIKENEVYFLIANKKENVLKSYIKNNERIDKKDYVVEGNYQLIKLNDYDETKDFTKQSNEIIQIINEYL